jgi:hypothetical protein
MERQQVTYAEARQIVDDYIAGHDYIVHDFNTYPAGLEDAEAYLVPYGMHHDRDNEPLGLPVALVVKATGELQLVPYMGNEERIQAMRPVL